MLAAASDTSRSGQASNEDLVVAIAVDVLAAKGWFEDEPGDGAPERAAPALPRQPGLPAEGPVHRRAAARHARRPPRRVSRRRARERAPGGVGADRPDLDVRLRLNVQGAARRDLRPPRGPLLPDRRRTGCSASSSERSAGPAISRNKACPDCGREFAATVKRSRRPAAAAVRGGVMRRPGEPRQRSRPRRDEAPRLGRALPRAVPARGADPGEALAPLPDGRRGVRPLPDGRRDVPQPPADRPRRAASSPCSRRPR